MYIAAKEVEAINADWEKARKVRNSAVSATVHLRGVIEFSNVCHRNCLYCGMRRDSKDLPRYTLSSERMVSLASEINSDGIKTVMIQGGDNLQYDVKEMCRVVSYVRDLGMNTLLCIGDRPISDYKELYLAGAQQSIVKFETTNAEIYRRYRPHSTLQKRLKLIDGLAGIGYQISSGFILGLPETSSKDTERDFAMVRSLPLFAVSVSPFIPNDQSPLRKNTMPTLRNAIDCVARLRLENPMLRIPSVSAFNLLENDTLVEEPGQLLALNAGANVITVNYTPPEFKNSYIIYSTRRNVVELSYAKGISELAGLRIA